MKNKMFFQEDPPAHHDQKVSNAVQESLRRNRTASEKEKHSIFDSWKIWGFGFSTAAFLGIASYWLIKRGQSDNGELLAFCEIFEAKDAQAEDLDLLAQDLPILENLDFLEEMEEES